MAVIDQYFGKVSSSFSEYLLDKYNSSDLTKDRRTKFRRASDVNISDDTFVQNTIKFLFEKANNESYHFDLNDKIDIHLIDYEADAVGFLDWHTDFMGAGIRDNSVGEYIKMSLSLGLNDDFEGGQLEFDKQFAISEPTRLNKNDYVIFPAFHRHRVLPVSKGKRVVCVAWAYGPNWK